MATFDQKFADLKRAHEAGIVVGLRNVAGIAYRLDIDVLLNERPDAFNLFLIALNELQNERSNNIMGYYQIAGIHGYPSGNWHDIPGRKGFVGDPGYCAHTSETFPTWHRPYLAMLEQAIFIKMFDVADRYNEPLKTQFRNAAFNWRLPYWDYYRPRRGPGRFVFPGVIDQNQTAYDYDYSTPAIFTAPTVTVRYFPDGQRRQLERNPLSHFPFQTETGQLTTDEWDKISVNTLAFSRKRTVRNPTQAKPDGDPNRLNSVLNELRMDSNRLAVTMVTNQNYGNYSIFSTNGNPRNVADNPAPAQNESGARRQVWGYSGSLEALHGMYHVFVGGWSRAALSGHMSQVPCAAFDPIFWGHHGQIERMFAVWQAVHANDRNNWLSSSSEAKAPLLPFLKPRTVGDSRDRFWTSDLSRNCEDFGYTYPDLDRNTTISVADRFRALYSWSIPRVPGAPRQPPPANMKPIDVSNSEFFKPPTAGRMNLLGLRSLDELPPPLETHVQELQVPMSAKADKTVAWDWYVDDRIERLALNTSFTISYFVLQSPDETIAPDADFATDPALVGVSHIFASPIETCQNCAEQADQKVVIRNTVPITSQLLDYITIAALQSMEPNDVVGFLKGRLKWRIVKADGVMVDPRTIPSLKINVSAKKTVLDEQTGQPVEGVEAEYSDYPELVRDIIADASTEAGHIA